jgi:beta-glucosidase
VTRGDEATIRRLDLPPYKPAVDAGAQIIMLSFSSWNGLKMHAQKYLLTDVLKGELGFRGFLTSDWQAIDQIPGGYTHAVVTPINAGVDISILPYDYNRFISTLTRAVQAGDVPQARVDDAVRRILTVKATPGLFEQPIAAGDQLDVIGSHAHRQLAREAVRKSLVLLKNEHNALPLASTTATVFVAGQAADDIGIQCGGWTIEWQDAAGPITPGTTLLDGIRRAASPGMTVKYNRSARLEDVVDTQGKPVVADVGIAVVGETLYAEGEGDSADLALSQADASLIARLRQRSQLLLVVLISGRPMVINDEPAQADAFVAAWLPGTGGAGVAEVLFGDYPFTGKLPYTWPRGTAQLPFDFAHLASGAALPLRLWPQHQVSGFLTRIASLQMCTLSNAPCAAQTARGRHASCTVITTILCSPCSVCTPFVTYACNIVHCI